MLVSIIVPAYNVEKYLERCIYSITNQTYRDLEIIIVDDGSTDATPALCDRLGNEDARIIVSHQANNGLSGARNTGLGIASGKYIFFVDSDDWIEAITIERMVHIMQQTSSDIVCCGISLKYDNLKSEIFTEKIIKDNNKTNFMEMTNVEALIEMMQKATVCSVAWNKLYKRTLWDNIEFPLGKVHEDEFTTYKLLYKANKVVYTDELFYDYYQRDTGIMSQIHKSKSMIKLDAFDERTQWFRDKEEKQLTNCSMLKSVEYVKYLYRNTDDREYKKVLLKRYDIYAKKIVNQRDISLYRKFQTIVWKYALPFDFRKRIN